MAQSDGLDIFYAGAGILWGFITIMRGVQLWRREQKIIRASAPFSADALPIHRSEIPSIVLAGFALAISCTVYLLWSLWVR